MNRDFNSIIKTKLENSDLNRIINNLEVNIETTATQLNTCCSNDLYLFIYIEQKSCLLAINLNKLSKCEEINKQSKASSAQLDDEQDALDYQILTFTSTPAGQLNKILINKSGTHLLLVYDKVLTAVELPSKWGKYNEYEGGRKKIICKMIYFQIKNVNEIVDATWHSSSIDNEYIVCLANISNIPIIKYFSIENSNIAVKSFQLVATPPIHSALLTQSKCDFSRQRSTSTEKPGDSFMAIDIGEKFEHKDRIVYPLFIVKSNGQIHCLLEYENSTNFEYLGALMIEPYCMDHDKEQVLAFMCLKSQPNCIVLLLNNGLVHHCLFMPTARSSIETFESTNFYEDQVNEFNSDALLFVYESVRIFDGDMDAIDIKFLKDSSNPFRYFLYHKSGVHSVYLPWLESAKLAYSNIETFDPTDYSESRLCEVNNLLCTSPLENNSNNLSIVGLTLISGYGSRVMLLALTSDANLICLNVYTSSLYNEDLRYSNRLTNSNEPNANVFYDHIKGLLKRELTIPLIKTDITGSSNKENDEFISRVINSVKSQYLDKQKQVFNELIKKSKVLREQSKTEIEKLNEIRSSIKKLAENKKKLDEKYRQLNENQVFLESRLDSVSMNLKQHMPTITDSEIKMSKDLKEIEKNLKNIKTQINQNKALAKVNEITADLSKTKLDMINEEDFETLKKLLKNENEKIKELVDKVKKLSIALKT